MIVGARAHDFGRMSEYELPKVIKEAGFDGVQLALTKAITDIEKFSDIKDSRLETIRNEFSKNKVEISVLGCYIEPSIPDKEQRLKNVETFRKGIEHAKELGVTIIATETTNFDLKNESIREETYQFLKDSVLRMVEKAEKENITIGIEPVADHTLNSPQLTRRLLDEVNSDKLRVVFDPVNMLLPHTVQDQPQIMKDCFDYFGEEIVAVHVKDIVISNGEKEWRNIGKGIVDYTYIFNWLLTHKPSIAILREHVRMDSYAVDVSAMRNFIEIAKRGIN